MSAGVISAFRAPSSLRSDGDSEAAGDDAAGEVVCAASPRSATVDEASDSGEALLSEPEQAAVANSVPAGQGGGQDAGRPDERARGGHVCLLWDGRSARCRRAPGTLASPGLPPHHRSARATSAAEAYR